MYKVLRKTTCSRKSVGIYRDTVILIEMYETPLLSRIFKNTKKGVSFDTILAYVKRGFQSRGDKGYNRGEIRKISIWRPLWTEN